MKREHAISGGPWLRLAALLTLLGFCAGLQAQNFNPRNYDTDRIMEAIKTPHPDLTLLIAHRGIHALVNGRDPHVPENSLQAIGLAAQRGWEIVEIDVKLTRDGIPVLSHDATWGRETCYSSCWIAGPFDPFHEKGVSCNNPLVSDLTLAQIRPSIFPGSWNSAYLRDSVHLYCAEFDDPPANKIFPPTLQDVLDYMRANRIPMVLSLDMRDAATASAAWSVINSNTDYRGRPFSASTVIKLPVTVFPAPADFVATFGSNFTQVNYIPVFNTSAISPAAGPGFGGEQALLDWLRTFEMFGPIQIQIVAVEVGLKESGGILTSVLTAARRHARSGAAMNVGNFQPVGEYYKPDDPDHIPRYFKFEGDCCAAMTDHLFNGSEWGLPSDTSDHRESSDFIIGTGNQFVTTDDPTTLDFRLASLGKRNISYMQSQGTALNQAQLVVLPLGDSITWGSGSSGNGYRGYLQTALSAKGYSVQYVGSQSSGNLPNPQNEGHPGYRIDQIAALTNGALAMYRPNVVLLLAGTNDMNQGYQVSSAPDRLGALIDQIVAAAPNTTVLVASLPPSAWGPTQANIAAFNARIPAVVEARRNAGARVQFVDMQGLTTADLEDLLHPNDSGYQKMANAWSGTLHSVSLTNMIRAVDACSSGSCGSGGHTPGPVGPAPGPAAHQFLGRIATGVNPPRGSKLLFADLNGDDRVDYVVVDPTTGSLTAWLNGGPNESDPPNWLWWPQGVIASGALVPGATVQLADLNGDRQADYVVVDPASGALQAFLNGGPKPSGGDWIWLPQDMIASGAAPGATVQFADVSGDGLADYLSVDPTTGAVRAWVNGGPNPSGGQYYWYPQGTVAIGVQAPSGSQVVFADINDDGYADYLSISSATGAINAWLNAGGAPSNWGWLPLGQLATGAGAPTSRLNIFVADLDADGRADLLSVNATSGSVQAWLNNGLDRTPAQPWVPVHSLTGVGASFTTSRFLLADLNSDGLADYSVESSGALTTYINEGANGGGASGVTRELTRWGWHKVGRIASGVSETGTVQLADLHGDRAADYLVADPRNGAVHAWGNGGGHPGGGEWLWVPEGKIASGGANLVYRYVQFADISGDGKADYLVASVEDGSVEAYLNGGHNAPFTDWSWIPQGKIASGGGIDPSVTQVQFADLNADGRADYLAVNRNSGAVHAWLNGGPNPSGGEWLWWDQGVITSGFGDVLLGTTLLFDDINGDGRADYVIVDGTGNLSAWLMNGGDTGIPTQRRN